MSCFVCAAHLLDVDLDVDQPGHQAEAHFAQPFRKLARGRHGSSPVVRLARRAAEAADLVGREGRRAAPARSAREVRRVSRVRRAARSVRPAARRAPSTVVGRYPLAARVRRITARGAKASMPAGNSILAIWSTDAAYLYQVRLILQVGGTNEDDREDRHETERCKKL